MSRAAPICTVNTLTLNNTTYSPWPHPDPPTWLVDAECMWTLLLCKICGLSVLNQLSNVWLGTALQDWSVRRSTTAGQFQAKTKDSPIVFGLQLCLYCSNYVLSRKTCLPLCPCHKIYCFYAVLYIGRLYYSCWPFQSVRNSSVSVINSVTHNVDNIFRGATR